MAADEKDGREDPAAMAAQESLAREEIRPSTGAESSPAGSASHTRPHYTPQFSATTEMILKRIRGEPNNLSSAISSASAAGTINKTSFEDAKRRLVMSMNTSISLPMPDSAQVSPPRAVPSLVLPKIEVKEIVARPASKPGPKPRGRPPKTAKAERQEKVEKKGKLPSSGTKRKRVGKDDDGGSSPLSEPPETEEEEEYHDATPTMTKSGRQILKPNQFNPTTAAGAGKRKHYGKRTAEQALCKVCTRGLSPINNQIVFCDGCNLCWHQMCHDPYIDDDFVSDEARSWFCRGCSAKREKHLAKKKRVEGHKGVSWPSKTVEQKRAYLSGLPQSQLVNLVMYSLELHPDLPVFPEANGPRRGRPPASAKAAPLPGSPGPIHFKPIAPVVDTPTTNGNQGQTDRERSEDIPAAWPKVGAGVLAGINLNEADFEDKNDFEAFSLATFDARSGKKVAENGIEFDCADLLFQDG
ncbi:hypothetical protein PFICI_00714 [Pestalotiopsis fici W106-1]|uniref:PHD-type domain-containing protein n=1 Tax=Pestalotiopsis fici (strain W106-1 / CGMCC3.15140) TaxID=1229662 RepID=W3XNP7_PESFW|nr:uncharacterized protein PFICI_00714 [Pestalotiopsis fici W106-1]ETS86886.1 hypothetical protein PFICI_00714 [Pestalotiopsis fici W106-1]